MTTPSLLAVNSGSSSLKYALFTREAEPAALQKGTLPADARESAAASLLHHLADDIDRHPLAGIGHRLVHGGPAYHEPVMITPQVLMALKALIPFAPNHLPDEIALIEALARQRPDTPQFACFDTGFHHDLPDVSRRLPIPASFAARGVRRYGFHGLSYAYLARELRRLAGDTVANGKVILAHLGNGSSLAALHGGRSMDTTMGFTPIGGVVMSTRAGDLDPGVVTHLARTTGMGADDLERLLSHQSGLHGISDGIADMRDLLASEPGAPACRLAVSIYCYEIRKRIGSYAAALGGIDTLVFSGGIGEHAAVVRERICTGLEFLGLTVDPGRNAAHAAVISTPNARATIRVMPTNEELMIALAGHALLG